MALLVDSTALSPTQNSYVSSDEMTVYVATRVPDPTVADAWSDLDPNVRAAYLVNATRSLDNLVEWIGDQYSRDQRLRWPRVNAWIENFLLDVITTPDAVKEATCEMALWAMQNSGVSYTSNNEQFDKIQVGPLRIDFNQADGQPVRNYFPDIVSLILRDYGALQNPDLPGGTRMKTVHLLRQ